MEGRKIKNRKVNKRIKMNLSPIMLIVGVILLVAAFIITDITPKTPDGRADGEKSPLNIFIAFIYLFVGLFLFMSSALDIFVFQRAKL